MLSIIKTAVVGALALLATLPPAIGQTKVDLSDHNAAQVQALDLGDPFFRLVLNRPDQPLALPGILAAIKDDTSKINVFVVSERIKDARAVAGNMRRAVISFNGSTTDRDGRPIDIDGTVMLSVFFNPQTFPVGRGFEAWGWDREKARYNFYRLEPQGWEFRGSSDGPDVKARSGCMACHRNGTPIMKEFMRPWPNWHSFDDLQGYLVNGGWPSASFAGLAALRGAEVLEEQLLKSLRRFHRRRVQRATLPRSDRGVEVSNAQALLRPIFVTTEVNLSSSLTVTGNLNPFSRSTQGPLGTIQIPDTYFLNARVIGNAAPRIETLGISDAMKFHRAAKLPAALYENLVDSAGLRLFKAGRDCNMAEARRGDAVFAWLHPEAALFDVLRIEALLQAGLVDEHFVAAAMATELRMPVFSDARASLAEFLPERYIVHADGSSTLAMQMLQAIDARGPAADSPEAKFATRLRSGNAKEALQRDVRQYLLEVRAEFRDPGSPAFRAAAKGHLERLIEIRKKLIDRPELCQQIEGPTIPLK